MTAQELRRSILQLAVQGKLVPQDPNDEPASELLKRINNEKELHIKGGKIKKRKTLPEITEYEQPFEIPGSWKWAHPEDFATVVVGATPTTNNSSFWSNGTISWLPSGCCQDCEVLSSDPTIKKITKEAYDSCSTKMMPANTVLIALTGATAGRVGLLRLEACGNQSIVGIMTDRRILPEYVFYQLMARRGEILADCVGSAQPHISKDYVLKMIFAIPPLAEQQRIVAKIEELLPLVEEYGKAEERLTALNAEFPDKLRKSILQQAIQGKLTERDPADKSASELLKRIHTEKERLIKEGKIKKEKPLPPITEEEMPFEIPDGWEYARLSELATGQITYGIIKLGEEDPQGVRVLRCSDVKPGWISPVGIRTVKKALSDEYSRTILQGGEIVINVRGTLGGCAIVPQDYVGYNVAREVAVLPLSKQIITEYLLFALLSPMFDQYLSNNLRGVAYKGLNIELLSSFVVPLPPLAEQQRIVNRVNELLAVCDELK